MNPNDVVFNQTIGTWLVTNAWAIMLILIWSTIWKGLALWKSAQNRDKVWFVVLLFINTIGILEIFYYFYFSRKSNSNPKAKDQIEVSSNHGRTV
ncbi:MAG: DUF5652 family protein [Candidatus Saccharibacteria bacterium]